MVITTMISISVKPRAILAGMAMGKAERMEFIGVI
jgi:hypothetical protein